MAEEPFLIEFIVVGAPASVNWKFRSSRSRKNYAKWKAKVGAAANSALPKGFVPIRNGRMQVTVLHFYQADKRDVDNILKAILDGLGNEADPNDPDLPVIWHDDEIVERIVAERFDNAQRQAILEPSPLVVRQRELETPEFVYVRVDRLS